MSVAFVLDPASVDSTIAYLEETRERILQAIRQGMLEAMEGLADRAVEQFYAAGLHSRTGETVSNIEWSPNVSETATTIRGTVAAETIITLGGRRSRHIGLWMEEGTRVPEVRGVLYGFTEPGGGETFFARGHRAFEMKPHPFLNPALAEYETTITEIIQQAVEGAIAA